MLLSVLPVCTNVGYLSDFPSPSYGRLPG
jgi:hypothetical protein